MRFVAWKIWFVERENPQAVRSKVVVLGPEDESLDFVLGQHFGYDEVQIVRKICISSYKPKWKEEVKEQEEEEGEGE